jgi:hypothetical protein
VKQFLESMNKTFVLATAAACMCLFAGAVAAAPAGPKRAPDVVIYDGVYPGWPWICKGADGVFYCVLREGTEHGFSAPGKIMFTVSGDQGKTWSKARVIIDEPGVDDRNVAVTELKDGRLLLVYNTYTEDKKSQTMGSFSQDKGKTWSKPTPIGPTETRTRAGVEELSDGSLLLPYYRAPGDQTLAARSTDGGKTWTTVEIDNFDGFVGDEWDALEVSPGRIIGIIRNSAPGRDGYFWMTESLDFGQTWSVAKRTNLRSERHPSPAEITMQRGKPTVIYPNRRMESVAAATTNDPTFVTWDVEGQLDCYRYGPEGTVIPDGSYLSSVSVTKNRRLLIDYEIREDSKRVTGYYVDFPGDW